VAPQQLHAASEPRKLCRKESRAGGSSFVAAGGWWAKDSGLCAPVVKDGGEFPAVSERSEMDAGIAEMDLNFGSSDDDSCGFIQIDDHLKRIGMSAG